MANTFLAAQGLDLKASLVERDRLDLARTILERAAARGTEVLLPSDLVTTDSFENPQVVQTVAAAEIPRDFLAVDIGPRTRKAFAAAVARSQTLFWNGPLKCSRSRRSTKGHARWPSPWPTVRVSP